MERVADAPCIPAGSVACLVSVPYFFASDPSAHGFIALRKIARYEIPVLENDLRFFQRLAQYTVETREIAGMNKTVFAVPFHDKTSMVVEAEQENPVRLIGDIIEKLLGFSVGENAYLGLCAKCIDHYAGSLLRQPGSPDIETGLFQYRGDEITAGHIALSRTGTGSVEIPAGAVPADENTVGEIGEQELPRFVQYGFPGAFIGGFRPFFPQRNAFAAEPAADLRIGRVKFRLRHIVQLFLKRAARIGQRIFAGFARAGARQQYDKSYSRQHFHGLRFVAALCKCRQAD